MIDRFTGATLEFLEAHAALGGGGGGGVGGRLGAGSPQGRVPSLEELFRSYDPVCLTPAPKTIDLRARLRPKLVSGGSPSRQGIAAPCGTSVWL